MEAKSLLIALYLVFCCCGITVSQQNWPIQVSGFLIPPHSLNLGVYGSDRIEDLSFNAILKDPEQSNLLVRLSISIERNGSIVYQTDPNYIGSPILLSQFENMIIDGNNLQSYLQNAALTGVGQRGQGSITIPEGFNQICLQLYGVERNVPISNKFCLSGNFRLNQPPQITLPQFGAKMKFDESKNMLFSWQPMHLGSANSPGPVEYDFEIVQLPQGTLNANDAFESALKIYNTTTFIPSLIYTQAEPTLEANRIYAWRVTAKSIMHPTSLLFQNNGKSEISTFTLYNNDIPLDEINPFAKPSPRGCLTYQTSYGPILNSSDEPIILSENQEVSLGYFTMKITSVNGDPYQGYSGTGTVAFPMLKSYIDVDFQNIKVNKHRSVYHSDRISGSINPILAIDTRDVTIAQLQQQLTPNYIQVLEKELEDENRNISIITDNGLIYNKLPLQFQQAQNSPSIAVVGIEFTPSDAYVNLVSTPDGGAVYAGTLIPATPFGIKNGSHLIPVAQNNSNVSTALIIPSIQLGTSQDGSSRMYCDCNGYKNMTISNNLQVSPNIILQSNQSNPVVFNLEDTKAEKPTYFGKANKIPEFEIFSMPGFTFMAKSAFIDLDVNQKITTSDIKSKSRLHIPGGRGIYMSDVSVILPSNYNITNQNGSITLDQGYLIINEENIESASIFKTNLLNLNKGKFGTWSYSIDSMTLEIRERAKDLTFSGVMKTPFFTDNFPYKAVFIESAKHQTTIKAHINKPVLMMPMWKATFQTENNSEVFANLFQQDNKYNLSPKCKFNGNLTISLSDNEFRNSIINQNKGEVIDALLKSLNLTSLAFQLNNLKLEGLSHDPFNEESKRYSIDKISKDNASLSFGNQNDKLKDASFIIEIKGTSPRLGLKLILVKGNSKIELIIWSSIINDECTFQGIEIKNIDLKCNCSAANVTPSPEEWDKIIDSYFEKKYSHILISNQNNGSLSNQFENNTNDLLKLAIIQKIKANSISWFPLEDNNKVFINFLNKYLEVEQQGSLYKGSYRDIQFNEKDIKWNAKLFNNLENEIGENLKLPIVITNEMWNSFGFKSDYNLPDNFKLIISSFTSSSSEKISNAIISMDLVAELYVDDKTIYVSFGSIEDIAIGPDKIDLTDKIFYLLNNVTLNQNISFLSSINRSSNNPKYSALDTDSYVRVNCDKGIELFNIIGNYSVNPNTLQSTTVNAKKNALPATFGFRLLENKIANNSGLLRNFIASLKTSYFEDSQWKPWTFTANNAAHITFGPSDNFQAYLDFDENNTIEASTQDELFTGLVFNTLKVNIPFLEVKKDQNGSIAYFSDTTKSAYFDHIEQNFNLSYSDTNQVIKSNQATLGTWHYTLDSIAFEIQNNELNENELLLKGKIRVPLFKDAPKENSNKWLEDYNDSWIDYLLNVGSSNNKLVVSGYLQEIEDKLFESFHIDGIGYKLENGSYMEIANDGDKLMAKAIFNGRIFYTIKPLNATISTLKFENLKLNHNVNETCKGEGIDGINSIDFGTWSPSLFSPSEISTMKTLGEKASNSSVGKKVATKTSENKFFKKFSEAKKGMDQIANFEINIHEPRFTCNKENDRVLTIGLELNISRDASNLTDAQKEAYNKNHPEETLTKDVSTKEANLDKDLKSYTSTQNTIKDLVKEKKELNDKKRLLEVSYKLSQVPLAKATAESRQRSEDFQKQIKEITAKLNTNAQNTKKSLTDVKSQWNNIKTQKSQLKTTKDELENVTNVRIAKANESKSSFSSRLKNGAEEAKAELKNAKETATFSITAGGSIDVVFNNKGFKRVDLNCLLLGGKFGPVAFTGGLNLFREESTSTDGKPLASTTKWGNGFLGLIKLSVLNNEFAAKFQTGVKNEAIESTNSIEDYRYWFADISFNSEVGIPLGQSGFAFTGVGGGFFYNMSKVNPAKFNFKTPEDNQSNTKDNNKCQIAGLEPGVSLSGLIYETSRYSMGGYLSVEISHKSKISAEVIASLQVKNDPKAGLKFENFGLDINGYCFYDDYATRKVSSPLIVKSNVTVTKEANDYSLAGEIKFRFTKDASPIKINAPEQVSSNFNDVGNWNIINFKLSKSNTFFRAGSWKLPNRSESAGPASGLYFLNGKLESPLINVQAGAYFQAGSAGTVDALPSISYLMGSNGFTNDLEANNPLNKLKTSKSFEIMAGLRLQASMKDKFFVVSYDANGLLGANIRLSKVTTTNNKCADFGKIGFSNGYYASGNVYADLKIKVDLEASVELGVCPFCTDLSGSYTILDAGVKTVMNFGFPNPSFITGKVDAEYSLLKGLLKGKKTVNIDVGKKPCGAIEPDPTVGLAIHKKIYPADGATDIKFLKKIVIENLIGVDIKIPVNPNSLSGGTSSQSAYSIYATAIESKLWLKEKGSNKVIKTNLVLSDSSRMLTLQILEELKASTSYIVAQNYQWKNDKGEKIGEEKYVTEFITGEFDDEINHGIVKESSPGRGQRYWRPGYGYPAIILTEDEEKIRKIFLQDKDYYYYVEVQEFKADGSQKYHRVPVSQYPFGSDNQSLYPYELDQPLYPGYPHKYYVTFRDFNKLEFGKASLCHLKLVRAIHKNSDIYSYDPHHIESDSIRYIYEYYFGTSTYDSMTEKLKDVNHNWNFESKSITNSQREIGMKVEKIQEFVDDGIATNDPIPQDKLWGIQAKSEGFDKYDIELLDNKLYITWDTSSKVYNWLIQTYQTNFSQNDSGVSKYGWDNNYGNIPTFPFAPYLKKRTSLIDFYNDPYIKIISPENPKDGLLEISSDEIDNRRLIIRKASTDFDNQYSVKNSNDFDLIIEDGMASTMVMVARIVNNVLQDNIDGSPQFKYNLFSKGFFEDNKWGQKINTLYPVNLNFSFYENKKNGYCYYYGVTNEETTIVPVFSIDFSKFNKKISTN